MGLFRTDGLLLRRQNLGEADRIVIFLSRERGKVRAIAHSARKSNSKLAGAIEPLTLSHLEYYGKDNADFFHLRSANILQKFEPIRQNYDKLQHALVVAELLDRLLEPGETQLEIFQLSLAVLEKLELVKQPGDLLILFKIRLLGALGYEPNFANCADCGNVFARGGAVYKQGQGMLLCSNCSTFGMHLSTGAVKHMLAAHSLPLERAFQLSTVNTTQAEMSRFLDDFLSQVSGFRLKSLKISN